MPRPRGTRVYHRVSLNEVRAELTASLRDDLRAGVERQLRAELTDNVEASLRN